MIELFRRDSLDYPQLFDFCGPVELSKYSDSLKNEPPPDLLQFWREIGAGEMFESETIFAPTGEESVEKQTALMARNGLPSGHAVFHTGVCISTWRDGEFHVLNASSFVSEKSYSTFDDWYVDRIRSEYASRYGMSALPTPSD